MKYNKLLNIFLICLISLVLISSVSASDDSDSISTTNYLVPSDLSNDDIQSMIDNAGDGDTFDFTSSKYDNISLVIDKQLTIISNNNATINTVSSLTNRAEKLGIANTFGFYFTSNSGGSILSGFNIVSNNSDYAIMLNASHGTVIENNIIQGAVNNILVKNSSHVEINNNEIYSAKSNGMQIRDINNISIMGNIIHNNGRSGIETSNLFNSIIGWNEIFENDFNGISMYNRSSDNLIIHNHAYHNTNGIYINSQSSRDQVIANTFESNFNDPNSELGGFETGNGLLFGNGYKTMENSKIDVSYNAFLHNENFQAKNNPENEQFKLGPNYFDSTDDENTFICPMLLAKILKLNAITVSNGIGLQVYEDNEPVNDLGTFDTKVNIDGQEYTATVENGKAVIDIDTSVEHTVDIPHGDKMPFVDSQKVAAQKPSQNPGSADTENTDSSTGSGSSSGNGDSKGSGSGSGLSSSNGNGTDSSDIINDALSTLTSDSLSSSIKGTNSSYSESESTRGEYENSGEQSTSESSSSGSDSGEGVEESSAYELTSKISKSITDNSGVVVIAILALVAIFIYGYRRKNNFE